jgi:MerR family transcriptional regulator, repressor of the yfmOP operon
MSHDTPIGEARLQRIQEVAAEVGLTARSIRYYEEVGLLAPAARSEGAYRLYDASDLERLRFIKGLRDDAGFSLAEIKQLLEDEAARARNRERFRDTDDPDERRALALDGIARIDRQIEILQGKIRRLRAMIGEARVRRGHLVDHVERIDGGEARTHVHVQSLRQRHGNGQAEPRPKRMRGTADEPDAESTAAR